jgi:hypothetical protein
MLNVDNAVDALDQCFPNFLKWRTKNNMFPQSNMTHVHPFFYNKVVQFQKLGIPVMKYCLVFQNFVTRVKI